MRSLLAIALALPLRQAVEKPPAPPPVGTIVHVTSTLKSELSIRFTAGGKLLRTFEQTVEEHSDAKVDVVASLGDGLKEEDQVGLAKPTAPPPFVRIDYDKCPVTFDGPDGKETTFASESNGLFFFERGAAEPVARPLYGGEIRDDPQGRALAARVRLDADAWIVGPRLAPLVLGRKLDEGAALDVPPAVLAPLMAQAVLDGTLTKATLISHGARVADGKPGGRELLAFGVTVMVSWKGGDELPVTATFELNGELLLVKATAQVFELKLSGPIRYGGTGDENGAKLEISGSGKLDFEYRAEPR